MRSRLLVALWGLTAMCLGPWQAGAAPVYIAATGEPWGITNTGPVAQTAEVSDGPTLGYTRGAKGVAGGVLGAYAHVQFSGAAPQASTFAYQAVGPAYGQVILDDIMISGPPGTVKVSLNLAINGTLAASTGPIALANTSLEAFAKVRLAGDLDANAFAGEMKADSTSTSSGTTGAFTATGVLAGFAGGFPGSGVVTIDILFPVPVGTPLGLMLKLSAESFVAGVTTGPLPHPPFVASGEATADFSHTLGFPTSGPVFNLPAGYTVNSVSGSIVNNQWAPPGPALAAAILPSSRSVMVGTGATAFATIINLGPGAAAGCGLSLPAGVPAAFTWQTTNGLNVPVGTPETPVDLAAGGSQSFVFSVTPGAAFTQDVAIGFDCADSAPAPVVSGLDTLLLVAADQAVPDIVALAATAGGDGIVRVPGPPGSGAFAVATVNVGVEGTVHVSADTGLVSLPVSLFVCETNPATGACLAGPAAGVVATIGAGATPTFAVFVPATGEVPFAPATNRVFLRFAEFAPWGGQGAAPRGATSVAVCTGGHCPGPP